MRLPDPQLSHAVLIGTGRYTDKKLPDLPVVGRTISDLAAALTEPVRGVVAKARCTVLEDQGDIRLIGRHLRSAARDAEDLLLVYFVGHGLVGGRRHELYLGLPDSEWAEPEFNSLEYDKLRSAVLDSTAATKIIILDCCFSGRAVSEAMADPVSEMVGQIEVDGTYVLASAERDQVALILPGEDHTAFTGRFLHLLRNGVPGGPELLTVDYLYRQLMKRMRAEGLSQPRKRATSTADLLALAVNRAFAAAQTARTLPSTAGTAGQSTAAIAQVAAPTTPPASSSGGQLRTNASDDETAELRNPAAVTDLLDSLRAAGADEQADELAGRAATHVALDDPGGVAFLLDNLWWAGAEEQADELADRTVAHAPLHDPLGVAHLLNSLREVGTHEQAAALLARDPAAHVALDDPGGVAFLLESLQAAGAHKQAAALLARDPAAHVALDDQAGVASLLDSLREAGADEQADELARRARRPRLF